jgi:hypothetical protein
MSITVLRPGMLTTLQDRGRQGLCRHCRRADWCLSTSHSWWLADYRFGCHG